jgi:hypothetical protein
MDSQVGWYFWAKRVDEIISAKRAIIGFFIVVGFNDLF